MREREWFHVKRAMRVALLRDVPRETSDSYVLSRKNQSGWDCWAVR